MWPVLSQIMSYSSRSATSMGSIRGYKDGCILTESLAMCSLGLKVLFR